MNASNPVLEKIDTVAKAFDPDGHYQREKLVTVVVYACVALLTVFWAISSADLLSNSLGARVDSEVIAGTGEQWFLIHNQSEEDWDKTVLTLNEIYILEVTKPIPAQKNTEVFVRDFHYNQHIPRPPQRDSWQVLRKENPTTPTAPKNLRPKSLKIETQSGSFTKTW